MLVGCYAPAPPQGLPCGASQDCPSDQRCFDGFCSVNAPPSDIDGQLPDDSQAPTDDGPLPQPMLLKFGERQDAIADTMIDTFLTSGGANVNNFGTHADLHLTASDVDPVLLRVDLSSVPSTATVTRATLIFHVTFNPIADGTKVQVFEMNESWVEGTNDNASGVPNQFQRAPNLSWLADGAAPPSREGLPASVTTTTALAVDERLVIDVSTDLVQRWLGNSVNNGIALIVDANSFYSEVASSEANEETSRPIFEIEIK